MRQRRRTMSIATDDCPGRAPARSTWLREMRRSLGLVLSLQPAQDFLGFLHIGEGEFAGFDEARHQGLSASTEQCQQIVNQPALRGVARDARLEDVKVPDLADTAHRVFSFQPIYGG